jgi:glycosyltransferase involved in cell wall biosynthesis
MTQRHKLFWTRVKCDMISSTIPFVTILTPVYNGERYLAECIESVSAQTFQNWEYIILNNCSKDRSLAIAERYARKDQRIRVLTNTRFVGVIENHNIAFSLLSSRSEYCKVVCADDRLAEECLDKMIALAETCPAMAMVGSYQQSGETVRWKGLPVDTRVVSGREICRSSLLDNLDVFGNPTSVLYRSDLVRTNQPFFPHLLPHADTSACYKYLQGYGLGFVHEILSTERVHPQQISSKIKRLGASDIAFLENFLTYGPAYLKEEEFELRKRHLFLGYYRWLGGSILKMKGREFWEYQTSRLRDLGYPIQWGKVLNATLHEVLDEMQNPRVALEKLYAAVMLRHENH